MADSLGALVAPFASTRLAMTVADLERHDAPLVYVNDAFTALTGYGRDEVLGRNCRFLQGPATDRRTVALIGRAVRAGRSHRAVLMNYRRDGEAFLNELVLVPLDRECGVPRHLLGMQREVDIARNGLRLWPLRLRRRGPLDLAVEGVGTGAGTPVREIFAIASGSASGLLDCIAAADHDRLDRALEEAADGGAFAIEVRAAGAPARERWLRLELAPDSGERGSFVGTVGDVTPQKALRQRLRLFETVIEQARDAIVVTEAEPNRPGPRIVHVNAGFTRMTGYTAAEAIGQTPRLLQGPETCPAARRRLAEQLARFEPGEATLLNYRRDGSCFWNSFSVVPVADAAGTYTHWISIQRDVTERRREQDQIRFLASHDKLTGVANRSAFYRLLAARLASPGASAGRVGLLALDLDRFNAVNDALGHDAGDAVLQEVARRLERCTRAGDVVARTGGDGFSVVLDAIRSRERAEAIARRVQRRLAAPLHWRGHALALPASIGIAVAPEDGSDAHTLSAAADLALQAAKKAPARQVASFKAPMRAATDAATALEAELRDGLACDQFHLHVQPQYELAQGVPHGAECLVRWHHPTRGLLAPGAFMAVAEERGLLLPLQARILDEAFALAAGWRRAGLGVGPLALNLTSGELADPDFAAAFRARLAAAGLAPSDLTVEVVERVLLSEGADIIRANLAALSELGVAVELDDFGTGFASLTHLRDFPIDRVKIDRSFIADIERRPADAAIVRAIVELAHNLGMKVIAEGVESEAQLDRLRRWSCDAVQGHFIARPMPAADLPGWLAARRDPARARAGIATPGPAPAGGPARR